MAPDDWLARRNGYKDFALTNILSISKAKATVSPVTIGSFPGSDRPLPCSATPRPVGALVLLAGIRAGTARRASLHKNHRLSLSENSLGLRVGDEFGVAPLKTPSALELMQHVARTHMQSPSQTPGDMIRLANKSSFPSSPFKLSNLFWGLENNLDATCSDASGHPTRSVLFSGWKPSSSSVSSGRVFKRPLAEATANSQIFGVPLPAVVLRCIEYLDNEGLNEIGLYRIPGSSSLVSQLKSQFDNGEDCDLIELSPDPHAVATLLKQFFRELPETILTPRGQLPSHLDNRALYLAEQIRLLVRDIPDPNYYALHWLTRHLARVDQNSSTNKMNTSNLGMIFCPTLGNTANLFRIFVTYNLLIFPLPKPPEDAALKRPSPRPYSVSSVVSSLPSESAHSSVNSLASLMKLKGIDPPSDSREAKNVLLFENIAALNELSQLIPHRQARHPDSAASTVHSRNSILSYQSNPRARRSRSIDSDTAQHLLTPATTTELPAEASAPRRNVSKSAKGSESSDASKLRSPDLLQLDYFDGTHMAHALLNMKTRRANPSINRHPTPTEPRPRPKVPARAPRDAVWPSLAEVDLTKTRANLRPVNRSDLTSPIDLTLLRVLPSLVSFHRCIDAYLV
ncbi:hypothetical protein L0F63_005668 [Massospora cicadina]|nr:hypothetical protein L0F63_005668 [Massospora cicadina]